MKYKVGDKVRVRGDLHNCEFYGGYTFEGEMESYRGKIVTITFVGDDYYGIDDCLMYSWTDEMFGPVEEMSAADAVKAFTEICGEYMCYECPIWKIDKDLKCNEVKVQKPEKVVEVLKQWKAGHEKKPIETEFANIIRVIEDTGSGKVCVHEEEIDVIPGKLNEKMEEVLKNWCKDHDGKFFTVLERICRVKE